MAEDQCWVTTFPEKDLCAWKHFGAWSCEAEILSGTRGTDSFTLLAPPGLTFPLWCTGNLWNRFPPLASLKCSRIVQPLGPLSISFVLVALVQVVSMPTSHLWKASHRDLFSPPVHHPRAIQPPQKWARERAGGRWGWISPPRALVSVYNREQDPPTSPEAPSTGPRACYLEAKALLDPGTSPRFHIQNFPAKVLLVTSVGRGWCLKELSLPDVPGMWISTPRANVTHYLHQKRCERDTLVLDNMLSFASP